MSASAYPGTYNAISSIIGKEGFSGLWRGNSCFILNNILMAFLGRYIQQKLRSKLGENMSKYLGVSTSVLCFYPLEMIRVAMMSDDGAQYSGIIDCLTKLYLEGGLYSGIFYALFYACGLKIASDLSLEIVLRYKDKLRLPY